MSVSLGMAVLLAVIGGYVIGAIPFGLLAGKLLRGIDVRKYGSGKIGTANVARSMGMRIGLMVMLLDMGKGAIAVFLGRFVSQDEIVPALAGIAAVAGHNWSVFIGFTGGRGVSTGVGGLFALAPLAGLAAAVTAFSTMGISRYVSVGSMAGAVVGAIALGLLVAAGQKTIVDMLYAVVAPLIIYQHRDNIGRLLRSQERRIGQKAGVRPPTSQATDS